MTKGEDVPLMSGMVNNNRRGHDETLAKDLQKAIPAKQNREERAAGQDKQRLSGHMQPSEVRIIAGICTLFFGGLLIHQARFAHSNYWIITDGKQSTATVTGEGLHGETYYSYTAAGSEYHGHSHRDWRDPRYSNVGLGGQAPVWYSASHPWLSSLFKPDTLLPGWPVLFLILLLELWFIFTLVAPRSRWSISIR